MALLDLPPYEQHPGMAPLPSARLYLHLVQQAVNWVPREAIERAAEHYGVSFLALYEAIAFDPSYCLDRRGKKVLEVCQGLACREAGSQALLEALEHGTGLKRGHTAEDGSATLLAGICQGRCAVGPNVKLNGEAKSGQKLGDTEILASLLK